MELSTPNKHRVTTTSTSLSHVENSPVFNYINSLSPIVLAKSIHNDQTLSLLSLASPQSVFASPQLTSERDTSAFTKRNEISDPDPSKSELRQSKENVLVDQLGCSTSGSSAIEVNTKLPKEHMESRVVSSEAMTSGSCGVDNMVLLDAIRTDVEQEESGDSKEVCCPFKSEKDLRKICRIGKSEDESGRDWEMLISNVADILSFDSFAIEGGSEDQKMVDPGTISFISEVLHIPQDNSSGVEKMESMNCLGTSKGEEEGVPGTPSREVRKQKEVDKMTSSISDTLMNTLVVNEATKKVDVKGKKCSQSSCKKPRIRRRCLFSEMAGAHKKKSIFNSSGNSVTSSQSEFDVADAGKFLTPTKTGRGNKSTLSGKNVGLHLNGLATTSRDGKIFQAETIAFRKKEINLVPCDNKHEVIENDDQTSIVDSEEDGMTSPKIKRHKLEYVGAACKRCNCKRSKCLKLYCDCFAAGLYCIEPCSCQDCFNKPAHEEIVLETRKQIESRNPLAFAPKVIRSTDSVSEYGDETNKTPASARHKRGCNCKRSSCLKKYCECFQGGVGCSSNCRCEGCKNTFGTKKGFGENEPEDEGCDANEIHSSDISLHGDMVKNGDNDDAYPPIPYENARSSTHLQSTFSRQLMGPSLLNPSDGTPTSQKLRTRNFFPQPRFQAHLKEIPENETPEILMSNCSPISGVKTASPSRKRVSPPHHGFGSSATWGGRKLILRSVPLFPSLDSPREQ